MKPILFTIAFITVFTPILYGQALSKELQDQVVYLIDCLRKDNKQQLAELIRYPLKREYPLPSINNKEDFLLKFNVLFDDSLKRLIVDSDPAKDWKEVGYRGVMLRQGEVWMDHKGKIIAINHQSNGEKVLKNQILKADKQKLHASLVDFIRPVYLLETVKYRIRIDELSNNKYRYASWPLTKPMSEKPDLVLKNGEWIFEGSGGNHRIEFKNAGYVYECSIIVLGTSDSPSAKLTVYKADQVILSQPAKIVK